MVRIKNMFPGGNTCHGFYSFYDYIVPADARRRIILKGGPGTGKSTLMKKLAQDFIAEGYDLEFHWCSSDNGSLDAIVLADQEIAVIDGTAPHIIEPRYPGAVDVIINLGECWKEKLLIDIREDITATMELNSRYFALAYSRLREAKIIYDEWASYYEKALHPGSVNQVVQDTLQLIFGSVQKNHLLPRCYNPRHLFASAITPAGIVTHLSSLIDGHYTVLKLEGRPGTALGKVLSAVSNMAELLGMQVQNYHSPFIPEQLEAVILPGISVAVVDSSGWITDMSGVFSAGPNQVDICLDNLLDVSRLQGFTDEIEEARQRFNACLAGAIAHIRKAKSVHDRLEHHYIPAMDFTRVESKRLDMRKSIRECLS